MFDEAKLRAFGRWIVRLQQHEDLSREETHEAYRQIWRAEQPDIQQGAFIAALRCKGETKDELAGITESHNEEWSRFYPYQVRAPEPHIGVLGVGMDSLKTVNISSGAAVLAAACGAYVHKVGAPGLTGISGSADVFTIWGVDGDVPGDVSVRSTAQCRLGFTSAVGEPLRRSGIARVLSQIRFGTSLHFAGPLGFHVGERHKLLGVPEPKATRLVCEVMREMGYAAGMTPCGGSTEHPGRYIDEISTIGSTHIAELTSEGSVLEYTVTPRELGVPEARYADIASRQTSIENARVVAQALAGRGHEPVRNVLAVNAAACLKVLGKAPDLMTGVQQALDAVGDGRAIEQLRALIRAQSPNPDKGLARLAALLEA